MRPLDEYLARLPSPLRRGALALWRAIASMDRHGGVARATALAFYGFLSIFPTAVLAASIAGIWLPRSEVMQWLGEQLHRALLPYAAEIVERAVSTALEARGAVTLVAVVGLLYSASRFFAGLAGTLDAVWEGPSRRFFLWTRVLAAGLMAVIVVVAAVSAAVTSVALNFWPYVLGFLGLDPEGPIRVTRTYEFLASILSYSNAEWEKLSIFLNFLIPKLPAPVEEDLAKGILESIDMDSYRVEKRAAIKIELADEDTEIGPVPTTAGGHKPEPELDRLSNIIKAFNDQFGNIPWTDADRVQRLITEDIPAKVAADRAYKNAKKNNDKQNARIEHDKALVRVMNAVLKDDTELFKQFSDNEGFRRWLSDTVFSVTYEEPVGVGTARETNRD